METAFENNVWKTNLKTTLLTILEKHSGRIFWKETKAFQEKCFPNKLAIGQISKKHKLKLSMVGRWPMAGCWSMAGHWSMAGDWPMAADLMFGHCAMIVHSPMIGHWPMVGHWWIAAY